MSASSLKVEENEPRSDERGGKRNENHLAEMNDKAKMRNERMSGDEEGVRKFKAIIQTVEMWCKKKDSTNRELKNTICAILSGSVYSFNPGGWIDNFCFGQNKCHITHTRNTNNNNTNSTPSNA